MNYKHKKGCLLLSIAMALSAMPVYAAKKLPGQAAVHSELAKAYEKTGRYQLAADHYYKQAALYKSKGEDQQSYLAVMRKADELNSIVEFYMQRVNRL